MEKVTVFGMNDCLSLPGMGWKYLNPLRTEKDEPINTYNEKYMKSFIRQIIKGDRVCAFNEYYISKLCDDLLNILPEEIIFRGNVYDVIEAYLNYKNKYLEII